MSSGIHDRDELLGLFARLWSGFGGQGDLLHTLDLYLTNG